MVKAKKHLGQHFIIDHSVSKGIVDGLTGYGGYEQVLEVGPGTGALTQFLVKLDYDLVLLDLDKESIAYLFQYYPELADTIIQGDFINDPLPEQLKAPFALIGNFPYYISTQIMFTMLEHRDAIPEMVGMFQKEVADRLISPPGNKSYGILSVLLQTWYDCEYLFTVDEDVFDPPPKVKSGVIRLQRNSRKELEVDEKKFKQVIKMAFNQRRKTLRNSLKSLLKENDVDMGLEILQKRPEQMSVEEFISLIKLFKS